MSKVVSISGAAPLSLVTVKQHLRVDGSEEDDILGIYLNAALETVEEYLWRKLRLSTISEVFPFWKSVFDMSFPVNSITSIEYFSDLSTEVTLGTGYYEVYDDGDIKNYVYRVGTTELPEHVADKKFPITVTYVTGYPDGEVPNAIINAMLILIGEMYENREDSEYKSEIKKASRLALNPYRLKRF